MHVFLNVGFNFVLSIIAFLLFVSRSRILIKLLRIKLFFLIFYRPVIFGTNIFIGLLFLFLTHYYGTLYTFVDIGPSARA